MIVERRRCTAERNWWANARAIRSWSLMDFNATLMMCTFKAPRFINEFWSFTTRPKDRWESFPNESCFDALQLSSPLWKLIELARETQIVTNWIAFQFCYFFNLKYDSVSSDASEEKKAKRAGDQLSRLDGVWLEVMLRVWADFYQSLLWKKMSLFLSLQALGLQSIEKVLIENLQKSF